ncbi:hypothetical protein VNO80_01172 [Phaseolus coccineus]|uniref:Uncharacterized protein n=1 Tax=Phaseolus coccineus TaxID=3886 RepID=A0AAN9P099_PHACN
MLRVVCIWIYLWIDDNSIVKFIGEIFIAGKASEHGGKLDNEVRVGANEYNDNCKDDTELYVGKPPPHRLARTATAAASPEPLPDLARATARTAAGDIARDIAAAN